MLIEGLFWFHPLVWWLGARMVHERERACDEEVLRAGSEPGTYAESILPGLPLLPRIAACLRARRHRRRPWRAHRSHRCSPARADALRRSQTAFGRSRRCRSRCPRRFRYAHRSSARLPLAGRHPATRSRRPGNHSAVPKRSAEPFPFKPRRMARSQPPTSH